MLDIKEYLKQTKTVLLTQDAFDELMQRASAQPETHEERTETHGVCLDAISRQAAIDAMESVGWYHQNQNKDMVSGANSAEHQAWYKAENVYKTLEQLPSAQQELIRCKDCKHSRFFDPCFYCYERGEEIIVPENGFCFMAERRTDEQTD